MENNLLFAHDGYISIKENEIYSYSYNNKIVERYLNIANNVTFLVRTQEISNDSDEKKMNKITKQNFKVIGIDNFRTLKSSTKYFSLTRKVKEEVIRADYIIARIPSDLGFLAIKYARKYKKKYMIEVVGCPWDSYRNHSIKGKLIAPYYLIKQKFAVKKSPYTLYVTDSFLQKRYPSIGKSIGCSDVELETNDEAILKKRLERISQYNDITTLGTIGALDMKYKGYETVIEALSKINSNTNIVYRYFIVGSGDSSHLKKVILKYNASKFVHIFPSISHDKIFNWLENIDIYIQPSKTEGMPRALIEAMSLGIPAIGSNVGGIPELIEEEFLFSNSNKKTQQITNILESFDIEKMKTQAYRNFYKAVEFDIRNIEDKRRKFYRDFINPART